MKLLFVHQNLAFYFKVGVGVGNCEGKVMQKRRCLLCWMCGFKTVWHSDFLLFPGLPAGLPGTHWAVGDKQSVQPESEHILGLQVGHNDRAGNYTNRCERHQPCGGGWREQSSAPLNQPDMQPLSLPKESHTLVAVGVFFHYNNCLSVFGNW